MLTGSFEYFEHPGLARDRRQPSPNKIRASVVPALLEALRTERNNDIVTGCLMALAKIGDTRSEAGASELETTFASFLDDPTQEIAETAALALGILAHESSIDTLVALMRDAQCGDVDPRVLVGSTEVPMRTRAFAAFGLGMVGSHTTDDAARRRIVEHLAEMLAAPELSTHDVKVAAMIAFGLTPLDVAPLPAEGVAPGTEAVASRQSQIAFLLDYFDPSKLRANQTTRDPFTLAHVPTALARLLQDSTGHDVDPLLAECGMKEAVAQALSQATPSAPRARRSGSRARLASADRGLRPRTGTSRGLIVWTA